MYLSKEQKEYLRNILINDSLRLSDLSIEYENDKEELEDIERKMAINNTIMKKVNKS